jgi:hypothetical protein
MQAQQDGKSLQINWTHLAEGKQHAFIVEDVARKDAASLVKLAVDGKSLGISQTQDLDIEIPALGDFRITNFRVDQSSSQHVVIQFSDPLNEKQNLDGLISLTDVGSLDS